MSGEPVTWIRDDDEPPWKPAPRPQGPPRPSDDGDASEIIVLRCFPCGGSGALVVFDAPGAASRTVRCPVCLGRGYVRIA